MPTIAITGCSSGFGRATARRFLHEGWRVIATVRHDTDRASLIDDARTSGAADRLVVVLADITSAADVESLRASVASAGSALNALVNNAGTAFPAPLELLPLHDLRAQLEVNVVAQLAVTQALLPMIKSARGTIINVSSISGRIASPGIGAYSASKFALEAMSDALRIELAPFGVRVVIIEPGSSPTRIWETSRARVESRGLALGEYTPLMEVLARRSKEGVTRGFPVELFAETAWHIVATASPRPRYAIPADIRRLIWMRRLMTDRFLDRRIRRILGW